MGQQPGCVGLQKRKGKSRFYVVFFCIASGTLTADLLILQKIVSKHGEKPEKSQYFKKVRVVHMKNTLAMSTIEVSEALYESIKELLGISYVSGPVPMEFDPEGNLVETVWPEQG